MFLDRRIWQIKCWIVSLTQNVSRIFDFLKPKTLLPDVPDARSHVDTDCTKPKDGESMSAPPETTLVRTTDVSSECDASASAFSRSLPSLPTELLCSIFLEFAYSAGDFSGGAWTELMLVCKQWRTIIVDFSILWSCILISGEMNTNGIDRTLLQLERSKSYPLTICCNFSRVDQDNSFQVLLSFLDSLSTHSGRIRSLHLLGGEFLLGTFLDRVSTWLLPIIDSLTIAPHKDMLTVEDWSIVVPTSLMEQVSRARLNSLTLVFCIADLTHVQNLSELSLVCGTTANWSLPTLLAVFQQSPQLQVLSLTSLSSFQQAEDGRLKSSSNVPLDSLQTFGFSGFPADCCTLLSYIDIPPTTSITVNLFTSSAPPMRAFLLFVRRRYCSRYAAAADNAYCVTFKSQGSTTSVHYTSPDFAEFRLDIHLPETGANRERTRRQIVVKTLKALPSTSISSLFSPTSDAPYITAKSWKSFIYLLPAVRRFACIMGDGALNMLSGLLSALNAAGKKAAAFPVLSDILVLRSLVTVSDMLYLQVYHTLLQVLALYSERGRPVRVVAIPKSDSSLNEVFEKHLVAMRKLGTAVHVLT